MKILNSALKSITPYVPFLTPALKKGSCQVDRKIVAIRAVITIGLALSPLIKVPLKFISAKILPDASDATDLCCNIFVFISALAAIEEDFRYTRKTANKMAANAYINAEHPSQGLINYILSNQGAVELLIAKNADLKKLNADESTLFRRLIEEANPVLFEQLIEQGVAKPNDFNSNEKFELWLNLKSLRSGLLLADKGFDVNIRNDEGYTPLLALLQKNSSCKFPEQEFMLSSYIRLLIKCGANPKLSVSQGNRGTNAMQMTDDPEILEILNQYA